MPGLKDTLAFIYLLFAIGGVGIIIAIILGWRTPTAAGAAAILGILAAVLLHFLR